MGIHRIPSAKITDPESYFAIQFDDHDLAIKISSLVK